MNPHSCSDWLQSYYSVITSKSTIDWYLISLGVVKSWSIQLLSSRSNTLFTKLCKVIDRELFLNQYLNVNTAFDNALSKRFFKSCFDIKYCKGHVTVTAQSGKLKLHRSMQLYKRFWIVNSARTVALFYLSSNDLTFYWKGSFK